MNAIDILRNEYPGDDVWQEFVNLFLPEWKLLPDKNLYLSMVNDQGIAMFLAIHMGQNSFDWLSSPCNALDKKKPCDVIRYEPSGIKIIKSLLMRMH